MNKIKIVNFLTNLLLTLLIAASFPVHAAPGQEPHIAYTDTGKGEALVLIHAFPTDKTLWAPQQELSTYFRVITLDLWGFGHSQRTDGQVITMEDYADEVELLLKKLAINKAIIGGESMGGYVALAFLNKYPAQVSGLILSNTQAVEDNTETSVLREKTAVDILEHGTDGFIEKFMGKALSEKAPDAVRAALKNLLRVQTSTALASGLRGMAQRGNLSNLLAATELPILIITSDQDLVVPSQQSREMHELAKNSQLLVLMGAGHLSNLEQPQQWNKAVIDAFYQK